MTLPTPLVDIRNSLISSTVYLGDSNLNIAEHVMWIRDGRHKILVRKQDCDAKLAELAEERGGKLGPDVRITAPFLGLEPVVLSAVVHLDGNGDAFWLTSDAGWKEGSQITKLFKDVKLRGVGSNPVSCQIFSIDFPFVHTNLDEIFTMLPEVNAEHQSGHNTLPVDEDDALGKVIKFRHALFKIIPDGMPGNGIDNQLVEGFDWHIGNWPVTHPGTEIDRDALIPTHQVVPLPAFTQLGSLIPPPNYTATLKGATVILKFRLSHWFFKANIERSASNTIVADVVSLRVLEEPRISHTPKRHRLGLIDPDNDMPSPSKKGKERAKRN